VEIDQKKGLIKVWNNGRGIPIQEHKEHKCYVPELVFGHLLTSSNYDDKQKKVTGGRNGYGAKLTNIFSKRFTVETQDSKTKKHYFQEFSKNMSVIGEPQISGDLKYDGIDFTEVTFEPDLKKFKMASLDDDTVALLSKRVYDMAGCTSSDVKVHLNKKKIPSVANFETYIDMYFKGTKKDE
jgi:DNA topoisomerase II